MRDEVLRINTRYLVEIVERFDLCPWARGTRESGNLRREVLFGAPDVEATLAQCEAVAGDERALIGLLIFPDAGRDDAEVFERFTSEVRKRLEAGGRPAMALAPFHPAGRLPIEQNPQRVPHLPTGIPSITRPAQLVPFWRRAPDPTIQLVRFSALDSVKGDDGKVLFDGSLEMLRALQSRREPTAERIARENFATFGRHGQAAFDQALRDIIEDRDQAYAKRR